MSEEIFLKTTFFFGIAHINPLSGLVEILKF